MEVFLDAFIRIIGCAIFVSSRVYHFNQLGYEMHVWFYWKMALLEWFRRRYIYPVLRFFNV